MELLQKFAAVEIQADCRITEMDRDYCERHQKAYETAISSFKELGFFWDDMNAVQAELLGGSNSPYYHNYLVSHDGPSISQQAIDCHIESLHTDFIMTLTRYFNSNYHVSVDSSKVLQALLPEKPEGRWQDGFAEMEKQYHEQMRTMTVRYQDVVEQIILWLDGRSFSEQAFHELYSKCHSAAWDMNTQKPKFERKKDTICFTGYFCHFRSWPYDSWEVEGKTKDILRGVAHFETGSYRVLPLGFSNLLHYYDIKESVVEFPSCEKVKQLKLFKNNRVDLKFHSPEYAAAFVNKYLGAVC